MNRLASSYSRRVMPRAAWMATRPRFWRQELRHASPGSVFDVLAGVDDGPGPGLAYRQGESRQPVVPHRLGAELGLQARESAG
jgi:hypothetical protein